MVSKQRSKQTYTRFRSNLKYADVTQFGRLHNTDIVNQLIDLTESFLHGLVRKSSNSKSTFVPLTRYVILNIVICPNDGHSGRMEMKEWGRHIITLVALYHVHKYITSHSNNINYPCKPAHLTTPTHLW